MNRLLFLLVFAALFQGCQSDTTHKEDQAVPAAATQLRKAQALEQQVAALLPEDETAALVINDQVIQAYREAIRLDSNYLVAASYPLGHANYLNKNYKESLRWLENAAAVDPDNYIVTKELGLAYMNTGQIVKAQESLAKSIGKEETEANRQDIIDKLFEIGKTSFEYGVEYEAKGEFTAAKDYKRYGIAVLRNAFDLHGSDPEIAKQIVAYADLIGEKEIADIYRNVVK